jgi:ERCC4-type nuclease
MEFHNIFSQKNKKSQRKKLKLIIDLHEKNSLIPSILLSQGIEIEFKDLKIGDYIANSTIIERKTLSDFISAILNKRIFAQLKNLNQYDKKLLILEGDYETKIERIPHEKEIIRGAVLSFCLNLKIPVIQTKNEEDTASYLKTLTKKELKNTSSPVFHSKIVSTKKEQKEHILQSFRGIGPIASKRLLENFKTIKIILNQPIEKLKEIIGKKAEIFNILDEDY